MTRAHAILGDGEREEMMPGLDTEGVSLGDRSKVRHLVGALRARISALTDAVQRYAFTGHFHTAPDECGAHSNGRRTSTDSRRAQDSDGGGVSSHAIALMATAAAANISSHISLCKRGCPQKNAENKQAELGRKGYPYDHLHCARDVCPAVRCGAGADEGPGATPCLPQAMRA
jgi:hypothetical protein